MSYTPLIFPSFKGSANLKAIHAVLQQGVYNANLPGGYTIASSNNCNTKFNQPPLRNWPGANAGGKTDYSATIRFWHNILQSKSRNALSTFLWCTCPRSSMAHYMIVLKCQTKHAKADRKVTHGPSTFFWGWNLSHPYFSAACQPQCGALM